MDSLSLLLLSGHRQHQQTGSVLPAAVAPGLEQALQDPHLPGPQVEPLAGERPFGMGEAVDEGDRVSGRRRRALGPIPAHLPAATGIPFREQAQQVIQGFGHGAPVIQPMYEASIF